VRSSSALDAAIAALVPPITIAAAKAVRVIMDRFIRVSSLG
jgi:hypothetical protein